MSAPTYPAHITWTPDPPDPPAEWRVPGYSLQRADTPPPLEEDTTACAFAERGCPVCDPTQALTEDAA